MTVTLNPPPPTPVEPVTEILHGVAVTDPYRWLEDPKSRRTREWTDQQVAYTREYLEAIPGRDRIRKRIEGLLTVESIDAPTVVANRYFFMKRRPDQEQPVIVMRKGWDGEEVPLVDPTRRGGGNSIAVKLLSVSPDGKLLAYGVKEGGEDSFSSIEVLDVDRREVLPDRLPRGFFGGLLFSEDRRGFYYSHQVTGGCRPHYKAVFSHVLGTEFATDKELFFGGDDPGPPLVLCASRDASVLGYFKARYSCPVSFDFFVHDLVRRTPPRAIVEQMVEPLRPYLTRDKIIAFTRRKAPNGRIVVIDLSSYVHDDWRDLVESSDVPISGFMVGREFIFVAYTRNNEETWIEIFDFLGQKRGEVPCPRDGTTQLVSCCQEDDKLFYGHTSFDRPPTVLCHDTTSGCQEAWTRGHVPPDLSPLDVEQVRYTSKDGTQIPMYLVCRKGQRALGPLPTFLTGYGGFGIRVTPRYSTYATFLMERGCLFAVANLRGGSEFGEEWHLAGKRRNKQNAVDDFISAAEWLLKNGHTQPGRLAIGGGSNAALLVGAALTQRPYLFRAALCLGPVFDMLRYQYFDSAQNWVEEFGSAENPEDFPFLRALSPYHKVRRGTAYPAVMLISGDVDMRCNPMHARKMAARLQASTNSGYPVLLDYKVNWGHSPVQPLTARIEALTDRMAFVCRELGLNA